LVLAIGVDLMRFDGSLPLHTQGRSIVATAAFAAKRSRCDISQRDDAILCRGCEAHMMMHMLQMYAYATSVFVCVYFFGTNVE
jgi:hypothetical protein